MFLNKWMIATATLCTLVANADPVPAVDPNLLADITIKEARDLITDFRIHARAGVDGATSKLEIDGRLPSGCVDTQGKLFVENTLSNESLGEIAPQGKIAFRIRMTNALKACLQEENARIDRTRDARSLRSLRDLDRDYNIGALSVEAPEFNDKDVVFFAELGRQREEYPFNPPLRTVSRARLQKERADAESAQRADLIRRLNKQYEKCQSNPDSLQVARDAVQKLMEIAAINNNEYEVRMAKLDEAEKKAAYKDLEKRIANGTYDELVEIREELREFAESNPELAKHAAYLSYELAKRALEAEGEVGADRYAFSDSVLADAQEFDLEAKQISNIKSLRTELEVEKMSYFARSGDMGSMMLFQFNYQRMAAQAAKRVQTDCYSRRPKMEACAASMKLNQRIQLLPQELNEGQHRIQQNELNRMRMMQAAMGVGGFNAGQPQTQQPWMPGQTGQPAMPTSMSSFDSRGMFGFIPSSSIGPSYTQPAISSQMGPFPQEGMSAAPVTMGSPWN
jgi:hypothetical protein